MYEDEEKVELCERMRTECGYQRDTTLFESYESRIDERDFFEYLINLFERICEYKCV